MFRECEANRTKACMAPFETFRWPLCWWNCSWLMWNVMHVMPKIPYKLKLFFHKSGFRKSCLVVDERWVSDGLSVVFFIKVAWSWTVSAHPRLYSSQS